MIGLALLFKVLIVGLFLIGLTIGGFYLGSKNNSVTYPSEIPPIDAAAPVYTETATFALG